MNTNTKLTFHLQPGGSLNGAMRVPGDKSISHRSIMLGSLAEGVTEVQGFLEGEDSLATLKAFRAMGVEIEGPQQGRVVIHGVGLHGLKAPGAPLDLGNSGTSMRLMAGLMAGQTFNVEMHGDASLTKRPMKRVTEPLALMGAKVDTAEGGAPPLKVHGNQPLHGIDYQMPVASAQVKSCLLLAGLYADSPTCVTEPAPTRDHTERMLRGFGYPVKVDSATACVEPGGKLSATTIDVPADISSATFFMIGAAIAEGSDVTLEHVGINPTRIGVINILRLMGADLSVSNEREVGGEPVADIRVRSSKLKGICIPEAQVPLAIDEFPALFVAAACAEGETRLTGAEELRVKESDRIQVMADGLQTLGVEAKPTADGIVIQGGLLGGGTVESHGDHRIAMSFAMAALRASAPITINDCANVNTSFPGFVELAAGAGLKISQTE
ncbi:MAG: 3-phosphoshikimate 1-carboxyvinyltransferase [Gammaproteobacteria bacterium]|nr:3-phosphoshikimate 1-carboxyvinyltransferase [Gammaproteobacteria bacterium]